MSTNAVTINDFKELLDDLAHMIQEQVSPNAQASAKINPKSCDWGTLEKDGLMHFYCPKCGSVVPFGEHLEVDNDCPSGK